MLKRLFRPVYGEQYEVRPKHWWNPRQRKAARIAAAITDHNAPEIQRRVAEAYTRAMLYGDPFVVPLTFAASVKSALDDS